MGAPFIADAVAASTASSLKIIEASVDLIQDRARLKAEVMHLADRRLLSVGGHRKRSHRLGDILGLGTNIEDVLVVDQHLL